MGHDRWWESRQFAQIVSGRDGADAGRSVRQPSAEDHGYIVVTDPTHFSQSCGCQFGQHIGINRFARRIGVGWGLWMEGHPDMFAESGHDHSGNFGLPPGIRSGGELAPTIGTVMHGLRTWGGSAVRVLLTGAAGFIGRHVRTALSDHGHEVVPIDLLLTSAHGESAKAPEGVERLDVRDEEAMDGALRGVDVVCHQAAVVGAGVDANDAPAFASHNDYGTAVLLASMHRAGCRRLVLASSMVVYGDGIYQCERHGLVEPPARREVDLLGGQFDNRCPVGGEELGWELVGEDCPLRPRSLYAASKLAQEHYALAWSLGSGGSVTALRYHNVYGEFMPRDTPYSGVAAMFRSSLEADEPPRVYEDGRQTTRLRPRPGHCRGQCPVRGGGTGGIHSAQRLLRPPRDHRRGGAPPLASPKRPAS